MPQSHTLGSRSTSVRTINGVTMVRYHDTDIVSFADSWVILDTGGWRTATTKLRMNQAAKQFGLNYHVYQSKGGWYVHVVFTSGKEKTYKLFESQKSLLFYRNGENT